MPSSSPRSRPVIASAKSFIARILSRCSVSKSTSACLSNSAFISSSSPRPANNSPAASHSSSRSVARSALVQFGWSSAASSANTHCRCPASNSACSGCSTSACACRYAAMLSCHAASVCRACSICRISVLNRFCAGVNAGPAWAEEICRASVRDTGQLQLGQVSRHCRSSPDCPPCRSTCKTASSSPDRSGSTPPLTSGNAFRRGSRQLRPAGARAVERADGHTHDGREMRPAGLRLGQHVEALHDAHEKRCTLCR